MSDKPKRLSDQDLKDQLLETAGQVEKTTLVKENNFPTEIIELPSKGLPYAEDNSLSSGKIEMKYMTAKEEDILTTQSYITQGIVLDKLFKALIVSNGEGKPVKYNDLLVGDKNAIMIAARVLGYGKDYTINIPDPFNGGEPQAETVDLTSLEDKPLHDQITKYPNTNAFEYELPVSKKRLRFKLMTHGMERKVEHALKDIKKIQKRSKDETDRTMSTRLKTIITAVDGEEDTKSIAEFVDVHMLALDSRAFRKYLTEITPDIDLNFDFVSNETGDEQEVEIPIEVSFFWPDSRV
tara:strand:- start:4222 stop:5106 length:885 start_codon:yes stop_codon:yes gene_type:complete